MKGSSNIGMKAFIIGLGALVLVAASFLSSNAASGDTIFPEPLEGPDFCAQSTSRTTVMKFGTSASGTESFGNQLRSDGPTQLEFPFSLPAGDYNFHAQTGDGFPGRESQSQPNEQVFFELLAVDGSVLWTSEPTRDVLDSSISIVTDSRFGLVALEADVAAIRVNHAAPGATSANSVRALCFEAARPDKLTVNFSAPGVSDPFVNVFCGEYSTPEAFFNFFLFEGKPFNLVNETGESINIHVREVVNRASCFVEYPTADVADCAVQVADPVSREGFSFDLRADGTPVPGGDDVPVKTAQLELGFGEDPDNHLEVVVTIDCSPVNGSTDSDVIISEPADPVTTVSEPDGSDYSESSSPSSDPIVEPVSCSASDGTIVEFGDIRLLAGEPTQHEFPFVLAAGDYSVFAHSADGYVGREFVSQPTEQWYAEFLAADGSVLATSDHTNDLADLVNVGEWSRSIGDITLDADAVAVRVVHATPGSPSQNSVQPICLSATAKPIIQAPAASEAPTAVEDDAASAGPADTDDVAKTAAPSSTAQSPADTTAATVDNSSSAQTNVVASDPVSTTPVETVVLDDVATAPVAQAQPGTPTFTG